MKKMIEKILIILVIIGIIGGIYRHFNYVTILGSLLDGIWALAFSLALYQLTKKYWYVFVPTFFGLGIEIFQYIAKLIFPNANGYYPGTPDIIDVIAYFIGSVIALVIILILKQITTEEK